MAYRGQGGNFYTGVDTEATAGPRLLHPPLISGGNSDLVILSLVIFRSG